LVLGFMLSWQGSQISKNSKIGSRVEYINRSTQIKEDFKNGFKNTKQYRFIKYAQANADI